VRERGCERGAEESEVRSGEVRREGEREAGKGERRARARGSNAEHRGGIGERGDKRCGVAGEASAPDGEQVVEGDR